METEQLVWALEDSALTSATEACDGSQPQALVVDRDIHDLQAWILRMGRNAGFSRPRGAVMASLVWKGRGISVSQRRSMPSQAL